jgi:hypothetical protein
MAVLGGHRDVVSHISLCQNDRLLSSLSYDKTVRLCSNDCNCQITIGKSFADGRDIFVNLSTVCNIDTLDQCYATSCSSRGRPSNAAAFLRRRTQWQSCALSSQLIGFSSNVYAPVLYGRYAGAVCISFSVIIVVPHRVINILIAITRRVRRQISSFHRKSTHPTTLRPLGKVTPLRGLF